MTSIFDWILTIAILLAITGWYMEDTCKGQKITLLGYAYMCIEPVEIKETK